MRQNILPDFFHTLGNGCTLHFFVIGQFIQNFAQFFLEIRNVLGAIQPLFKMVGNGKFAVVVELFINTS